MHPGILLFTHAPSEHHVAFLVGGAVVELDGRLEHSLAVAHIVGDEVGEFMPLPSQERSIALATPGSSHQVPRLISGRHIACRQVKGPSHSMLPSVSSSPGELEFLKKKPTSIQ